MACTVRVLAAAFVLALGLYSAAARQIGETLGPFSEDSITAHILNHDAEVHNGDAPMAWHR